MTDARSKSLTACSLGLLTLLAVACESDPARPAGRTMASGRVQDPGDAARAPTTSGPAADAGAPGSSPPSALTDAAQPAPRSGSAGSGAALDAGVSNGAVPAADAGLVDAQTDANPPSANELADAGTTGPVGGSTMQLSASAILSQQCPASTETNQCYACTDEHCCETYATYAANPEALATRECLLDCYKQNTSGLSCAERCHRQHPLGTTDFAAHRACYVTLCATEDTCANGPVDPCVACANEHCALELVSLRASLDGYLFEGCVDSCDFDDTPCSSECLAQYPNAEEPALALANCNLSHCPMCD